MSERGATGRAASDAGGDVLAPPAPAAADGAVGPADVPDGSPDDGRAFALSEVQRGRLLLYAQQRTAAVNAENEAFTNILIGLGVDLVRYEARLDDDGARVVLRERTS